MDRVRLGRALGYGTRHAAKTVAAVVEAAASAPAEERSGAAVRTTRQPARERRSAGEVLPAGAGRRGADSAGHIGRGFAHLRRSVWQPLAVFSGALWLRVTGLFFGLMAFTIGAAAWRLRAGWHGALSSPESTRFWLFVGVAAVFAYFAVSSFMRATVRERRAGSVPPAHP